MYDRGVVKGIVLAVFEQFFCLDFDDPWEGGDNDHAVVGFALRFALNARPTGSQGATRVFHTFSAVNAQKHSRYRLNTIAKRRLLPTPLVRPPQRLLCNGSAGTRLLLPHWRRRG